MDPLGDFAKGKIGQRSDGDDRTGAKIQQGPADAGRAQKRRHALERRLRDSFGVHSGEGSFEVVLRFNAKVADYIREKRWHDSQELRELKGGAVELRLKLSSLVEIERWVLSWGEHARVVAPEALQAKVRKTAEILVAKYK